MALDSRASPVNTGVVRGQVRVGTRRLGQVEFTVRIVIGAVPNAVGLTVEVMEPRLDLSHVPDQTEQ